MFGSGRIVVIDDEPAYLSQLTSELHRAGIPCVPIVYPDGLPAEEAAWLRGCRIAFCDLHLIPGVATRLNYGAIGALLDRMATNEPSSLLLVLWTSYLPEANGLMDYLVERHPTSLPAAILGLDKNNFVGARARLLPDAIRARLDEIPQLRALYEWQDDVDHAAGACVGSLVALARTMAGEMNQNLDKVLSALAQKATGLVIASEHPGAALQDILSPILADRLSHLPEDAGHRDLWIAAMPSAVGKVKCGSAVKEGVAAINTALHVALPRADKISARERGAVVAVPCQSLFRHRFSTDEATVRARFAISTDVPVRWVGIQVEAACDHAQRKSLSIPFVLGAEIAADVKVKQKPGGVWESPVFLSDEDKAVKIVVNVGLTASVPAVKASRRNALYRFRESLLNSLAMIKAQHETRPGIIMLDGND